MGARSGYAVAAAVAGVVGLACSAAQGQGAIRYGVGRPDLVFVSGTVRLSRGGETVRRLERPGPVEVEAEVQNKGVGVARGILVGVDDNGKRIGAVTVPILVSGATVQVRVPWNATRGPHELTVAIDPDRRIEETNEGNNVAVINASLPRLSWAMLALIVVLALAAGLLAGYAAWQLWGRPRPTSPPPEGEAAAED